MTACGKSKKGIPQPAFQLYRSPRIKAVYNRRNGQAMAILSARYGLVKAEQIIEPYEQALTKERATELIPQISKQIQEFDYVLYYRGGAGRQYYELIETACEKAGKNLLTVGYKNLGDINKVTEAIKNLQGQDSNEE